ncbi:DUF3237 domain-containing protein [Marinomonas sp. IMCC 4694]|uniref:DUF3237 domain-containing protein n=1 Tax=Marinomonas sp. IMCC 4694 TaxID=2605432 RepID=UPI0011E7CDDB|nr:DUF3237 domain-containing protein [Marinomonas sp. IMCC 4694]TYL49240.1 DUF3237 domain-containing protein [Marinomonas sp. IMCC 4694]
MSDLTPRLEYAFTLIARIGAARSAGKGVSGERLHIPITGGHITGPKLQGRILPGGSDWPVIRHDGHSAVEAHYSIETEDGTLIYVVNKALRRSTPEVLARLRAGDNVPPDEFYFRGAPVFDVPDGSHQWLRESVFVCTIEPQGDAIAIAVYEVI